MLFSVGDACEVAGSPEDGFAAAWFRGRVERVLRPSQRTAVSDVLEISFPGRIVRLVVRVQMKQREPRRSPGVHTAFCPHLHPARRRWLAIPSAHPCCPASFTDFIRPNGTPEIEHHPARSLRVRPTQPALAVPLSVAEYQVGAGRLHCMVRVASLAHAKRSQLPVAISPARGCTLDVGIAAQCVALRPTAC